MNVITRVTAITLLMAAGSAAHAVPYLYTNSDLHAVTNAGNRDAAGKIQSVYTTYDTSISEFSWSYVIDDVNGKTNDAFWLVVSAGDNPKTNNDTEYAILYGDMTGSTTKLQAYRYNSENNNRSYKNPADLLGEWEGDDGLKVTQLDADTKRVSLRIDVSDINSAYTAASGWSGISFAEKIGIWFHPTRGSSISYYGDNEQNAGLIKHYQGVTGWHDSNDQTTKIPEPGALALFSAGLLGFGMFRLRRNKV